MPRRNKKDNLIKKLLKQAANWLGRRLQLTMGRRHFSTRAGFVLPTVTMVALVVVLLTTAIMLRSFDRTKNASNYRVNQVTLSAAEPALARAQKKLDRLFSSPDTRGTPSEQTLNDQLTQDLADYTLPDEDRLQITLNSFPTNAQSSTVNAWRFPVDTDNNGRFDSLTLYSILFYSPLRDTSGDFSWPRTAIEARTPPQDDGAVGSACEGASATSAALVGASDWYESAGRLKKPFFTYVATVPITDVSGLGLTPAGDYENYIGNRGFSALEYQQDRSVLPPSNNAVYYEDDLDIFSGPDFRINGRVFTNSNLFVSEFTGQGDIEFYQVSSEDSCFYLPENAKIVVAGNVGYSDITTDSNGSKNTKVATSTNSSVNSQGVIKVDLYKKNSDPTAKALNDGNKSINHLSSEVGYNTQAYAARIREMVNEALNFGTDPEDVTERASELTSGSNPKSPDEARREALEIYFRDRTRRVPYAEVPADGSVNALLVGGSAFSSADLQGGGTNNLRPPDEWIYPYSVDGNGDTAIATSLSTGAAGNNIKLALKGSGSNLIPQANDPDTLSDGEEKLIGDRILIGNGLPASWYDPDDADFANQDTKQNITGSVWDSGTTQRYRKTRSEALKDLDIAARDNFWESEAGERAIPPNVQEDGTGGVRIITGAGIYLPGNGNIANASQVVWPDTMPQPPIFPNSLTDHPYYDKTTSKSRIVYQEYDSTGAQFGTGLDIIDSTATRPYLQMRATVVYHYLNGTDGSAPIACVSSFYDPTNIDTARNKETYQGANLADVSGFLGAGYDSSITPPSRTASSTLDASKTINNVANSNNGITYAPVAQASTTVLNYQADLVYPNGRLVNPLLYVAKTKGYANLTQAQQSAVDATSCGLAILNGTATLAPSIIPDGTIQEVTFLDARQVKSLENNYDPESEYVSSPSPIFFFPNDTASEKFPELKTNPGDETPLPIEDRQPLEIRATAIDLAQLRQTAFSGGENLIPDSGIVYASRNDALPDITEQDLKVSASDFRLDPTRRPNGIVLINGREVHRSDSYDEDEKGFILASNLPVYVKGNFNLHKPPSDKTSTTNQVEEFTTALDQTTWGNFYDRSSLETQFACRAGDPRLPSCTTGDSWRAATIVTDAMTLLSDGFRFGFRNEGDYDLRNNRIDSVGNPTNTSVFNSTDPVDDDDIDPASEVASKRRENGFLTNDFVVNGLSSGAFKFDAGSIRSGFPQSNVDPDDPANPDFEAVYYSSLNKDAVNSSYFNNFVTPIQRRVKFNEYLMEVCPKLPVSECGYDDWEVNPGNIKASDVIGSPLSTISSGTTAQLPTNSDYLHFPRRVAFQRITTAGSTKNDLDFSNPDADGRPVPLGIDSSGNIQAFPYGVKSFPRLKDNTLWYRTTKLNISGPPKDDDIRYHSGDASNTGRHLDYLDNRNGFPILDDPSDPDPDRLKKQPILVPILQVQVATGTTATTGKFDTLIKASSLVELGTQWLARATGPTTTNMVMATGDTPSRPETGTVKASLNGGLGNLPHFIENWLDVNATEPFATNISGSFIQLKRSEYATAPWWNLLDPSGATGGPFNHEQVYKSNISDGKISYFHPPGRSWGFDVGLLSQPPDLFSRQFASNFSDDPNEFFREVSRSDQWVEALLCSAVIDTTTGNTTGNAVNNNQRPGSCP